MYEERLVFHGKFQHIPHTNIQNSLAHGRKIFGVDFHSVRELIVINRNNRYASKRQINMQIQLKRHSAIELSINMANVYTCIVYPSIHPSINSLY